MPDQPKILFYHPRSNPGKCILPMPLLALGGMVETQYEYEIMDGNAVQDPLRELEQRIEAQGYNLLAVTVMPGPQLIEAVHHTRELKRRRPGLQVVWGGYFPTQHTDIVLQSGYVDYVVRSQGELTFLELVKTLENGGDLRAIKGLSFVDSGAVRHNPLRELVSPDSLPAWPYHKLDMPRYLNRNYMGSRVLEHSSSFGCPFACNFCAVVSMSNRRWLAQSPARLASLFLTFRDQHGADAVNFHDMDFFVSEARVAEFSERIRDYGMSWWGLGRIDTLLGYKDSTWQKMKASGLKMIFSGAESGSDETLKRMNKGGKASAHATLELARRLKEYGIVPEFSFVMGNPPDPLADIRGTIQFIRKIKQVNPATEVILYIYTPVPLDGDLYNTARALGFRFPETLEDWVHDPWREFALRRNPRVPWMDQNVQRMVRNFERVLNAYYPTVTDTHLRGLERQLSHALSAWRYRLEFYDHPLELRFWQRLVHYQRPETTGF